MDVGASVNVGTRPEELVDGQLDFSSKLGGSQDAGMAEAVYDVPPGEAGKEKTTTLEL
jgi:hypothetical protein